MANYDPQDEEIERVLQEYFASERADLRAPNDLWQRLENRLGEQSNPSRFSAIGDRIFPKNGNLWSPAFATAGVAAVALIVTASVWAATGGFSGEKSPEGLVSNPGREAVALFEIAPTTMAGAEVVAGAAMSEDGAAEAQAEVIAPGDSNSPGGTAEASAAPIAQSDWMMPEPMPARVDAESAAPDMRLGPTPAPAAELALRIERMGPTIAPDGDFAAEYSQGMPGPTSMPGPTGIPGPQASQPWGRISIDEVPPADSPPDTEFKNYGRLPFVATAEDPLSTFSLDTDRTSYQLALNWALKGYQVDPESVRAEEWVNAFDYGYAPPNDDREFAISSDITRHPLDNRLHLARISFQAPEAPDNTPLNVTLVLDASGSMADGNRVAIAREAAESIRRSLSPRDSIAIVHFTDLVIGDLTVGHSHPDESSVGRSISSLAPHNSTNVQAGLDLGVQLADQARRERPGSYNYVILMSDGVANVDSTNPFGILESAYDRDSRNPLRIISIGVGISNYNDYLLEQLAQHGNGWYRYLSDVDQARTTFSRENWLALSTPVADQTRAQVTWDPRAVKSWRIIGYENRVAPDAAFTQDRKEFAELPSGAATTVFYELELRENGRRIGRQRVAGVELRWVEPNTGESRRQSSDVSGSMGATFERHADPWLQFGAIVALASDRYSGLSDGRSSYLPEARSDLVYLLDLLRPLNDDLGSLPAYNDFRFLLKHISDGVKAQLPTPTPPSGYSR